RTGGSKRPRSCSGPRPRLGPSGKAHGGRLEEGVSRLLAEGMILQPPPAAAAEAPSSMNEERSEGGFHLMRWNKISDAVVRRLPLYLRVLEEASREGERRLMSSQELGERAGVGP